MDQSQSDGNDSDSDDNSIMFNIPEEIMEPVDDPGFDPDQTEGFEANDGSFEPDGFPEDSAYMRLQMNPPVVVEIVAICQKLLFSCKNSC